MNAVRTQPRAQPRRSPSPSHGGDGSSTGGFGAPALQMAERTTQPVLGAYYGAGPALSLGGGGLSAAGQDPPGGVQFKLAISRPSDPYEREANAAADRVTSGGVMPSITPLGPGALSRMATLQRAAIKEEDEQQPTEEVVQPCACEEEQQGTVEPPRVQRQTTEEEEAAVEQGPEAVQPCENCDQERNAAVQRQSAEEEEGTEPSGEKEPEIVQPCADCDQERRQAVQRQDEQKEETDEVQMAPSASATVSASPVGNIAGTLSHPGVGAPLAPSVRSRLETGLGSDLSKVRVHSDGTAHRTARALNARAFTHGKDIWLGPGESPNDQKLLAHEATHVVQQDHAGHTVPVQRRGANPEAEAEPEKEEERTLALQTKLRADATRQLDATTPSAASVSSGELAAEAKAPSEQETEPEAEEKESPEAEKTEPGKAEEGGEAGAAAATAKAESLPTSKSTSSTRAEPSNSAGEKPDSERGNEEEVIQREPAPTASAGSAAGGGGETQTSPTDATCAGGGVATCYRGEREKPDKEPEDVPSNPPPTEVKKETSDGGEEDAPEPDNCPPVQAQTAQAAGSGPGAAPGGATGSAPSVAPGNSGSPAAGTAAGGPAGPAGTSSTAPASAGAAEPVAGAGVGGGPAAGGGTPDLGSTGETSEPAASGSPMEATISLAESGRATSVSAFENSSDALDDTSGTIASLRRGTQFAQGEGSESANALQRAASTRADRFFVGVADRLDAAVALAAGPIPDQLGQTAEAAKQELATSTESQKALISQRIQAAKAKARDDANAAQRVVNGQTTAFQALVRAKTTTAIQSLTQAHAEAAQQVTTLETTTLNQVNEIYAKGRTDLEGLGTKVGAECIETGEAFATKYESFKDCTEDAWYDGNLSERRALAQAKAAREVAAGFRDRMVESARKRAREIVKQGRTEDRCAVIASANQTRDTLDKKLSELKTALEKARDDSIKQADTTRTGLIVSIRSSLEATERQLERQEAEQRQLADDTRYVQQLLQEQTAHAAASAVQQGVRNAVEMTQSAVSTLQAQFAANRAPDPAVLDETLSLVEERIEAALGGLDNSAEGGAAAASGQLQDALEKGLGALQGVTQSNDELTTSVSDGFSMSMRTMGSTDHFAQQRAGFTQQVAKSTTDGKAALNKAVDGMREGCDKTTTEARDKKLVKAGKDLEQNLRQGKKGLECQITQKADEAASKERPAWKTILAVLLVIIVIVIIVAVTILTAGGALAGLGFFATVGVGALIGAAVGAVTSGLLYMAGNLWANQDITLRGLGKAALVGAITGAIGGAIGAGVGFGVGLAVKGASSFVQVAAQFGAAMVTAGGLDVVTQYVMGGFSFKHFSRGQLGLTLAITALTFGIGHVAGARAQARAGAPAPEPTPTPTTPEPTTTVPTTREPTPTTSTTPEPTTTTSPTPEPTTTAPEPTPAPREPTPTPEPTSEPTRTPTPEETPRAPTPEENTVLESTTSKNSEELAPAEVNTERQVANRDKGRPIDEPPFTTEHDLPNGHKIRETPDGEFFERCSGSCAIFDEDGNLVRVEEEGIPESVTGAAETEAGVAHEVGVQQGREAAADLGLEPASDWVNPLENRGKYGQGFDEVLVDANGDYVIGEYKGGTAELSPGQMERPWVQDVINRMRATGDVTWANRLQAALNAGKLRGVTFRTPIDPVTGVPGPTEIINHGTY